MSKVKSVDTKAELLIRSKIRKLGHRFRSNDKKLLGKPDIVLPKIKIALFVHGCFWHRHSCKRASMPSSNIAYWKKKFARNIQRFKEVRKALRRDGWKVIVVWECQTTKESWLKKLNPSK